MMIAILFMPTGIMAQSWTASAPEAGTFYLYNVGKNAFMTGGNDWDTRATLNSYGALAVTLISTDNASQFYVSTSPTYSNLFLGSDGYVDKSNTSSKYTPWEFAPVDGMTNVYTMKTTNDNTYIYGREADTKTSVGASFTGNWGHWMLISRENMINYLVANATTDNPVDATFAIQNAKIGRVTDATCWQGSPVFSGVDNNYCFEKYNTTFDVYQEIENMPNGVYTLKCQGFYRMGGRTDAANNCNAGTESLNALYYINSTSAPLKSIFSQYSHYSAYSSNYNDNSAYTINGTTYYIPNTHKQAAYCCYKDDYWNEPIRVVVTDGKIRIGVKKTTAVTNDWTIFDNFVLTYYGVDINELLASKKIEWEKYKEISDQAFDHSAFDAVLAGADDYCTTEAKIEEYDGIVWNALCDLLKNQTTATGQFDITSLIKNSTFDSSAADWTTDGTVGSEPKYGVVEFYGQGDVSLSQTLANMPAGNYTLKVQSFFRSRGADNACKQYESGTDEVKASLFMGDASVAICNIFDQARYVSAYPSWDWGGVFQRSTPNTLHGAEEAFLIGQYWNVLRTSTTSDGDINLGLRISDGGTTCWVPFDNFKLYYGASKIPVSLVSDDGLTLADDTYADITSDITLTAGQYNKVCLPFDLDETQTAEIFSNAYSLAGVNEGVGQLMPVTSMEAGKAYFVTVDATKTLAVNDVRIRVTKPDSIPVIWEGAATVGKFEGFTFDVNPSDGVTITSYEPIDYQNLSFTVNQENWRARRFLNEVTYTDDMASQIAYFDVAHPMRLDQPHSVFIPVPQNTSQLTATISTNSDYSEPETFTFDAGTTLCEVPNLIPQNTYYFKVEAGGTVIAKGQLNTEGHVRMIKASSTFNIRDLGGRETIDGKRVRYGKVFRGGELNYGHTLSDADKAELLRLGVGAEIDWRRDDETNNENPTTSILGDGVNYLYMNMDYADLGYAYDVNQQKFKTAFNFTLDNLRQGKAVYFHCRIGADRTGAFALLLDGLCGMTFDQLVKDYELTSYSEAGKRPWDDTGNNNMIKKYQYIKSLPGNNLHEKFFYYCNTVLGIPAEDLIEFITIMVGDDNSLTNADLAFMNPDGLYLQDFSAIKAICSDGSEVKSGAKAILNDGSNDVDVNMTIDHIQIGFDGVELAPNTNYILTIPAGSIEKDGVENAADATLSFITPMVFDGIYYLYSQRGDGFMGAGHDWGTCAFVDKYGLPFEWIVNQEGRGTIRFLDADNTYLYGDNWVYVDGTSDNCRYFETMESPVEGYDGFQLKDIGHSEWFLLYLRQDEEGGNTKMRMASNGFQGENFTDLNQTIWQFWTKEQHDEYVGNYPTENINNVIDAAGITATSDDFTSLLADNYDATDMSSSLGVTTSFGNGLGTGWTFTSVRASDGYPDYSNRNGYEYARIWEGTGTYTCTVSKNKLPRGIYKIELGGFSRHSTEAIDIRLAEEGYSGITSAFLKANDEQVIFTSWYDMNKNAEAAGATDVVYIGQSLNEQAKYVNEGYADNTLYVYLDGQTDLTLNVAIPWHRGNSYTVFNNLRVTRYVENVTISETDESPATAKEDVNVTLERTLQPDILNTFSVPFSLSAAQIADSPLKDATIYEYSTSTADVVNFDPTTTIEAGKPYIVKFDGSENIVNPEFKNVTVVNTEGETVGNDDVIRFVGQVYYNKGITDNYPYVFYITTSGESKRLKQTGSIKGLRAYYLLPSTSEGVKAYFNDVASSVDELPVEGMDGIKTIYDLSGRKINQDSPLMPGIYIVNGKKVMIK